MLGLKYSEKYTNENNDQLKAVQLSVIKTNKITVKKKIIKDIQLMWIKN